MISVIICTYNRSEKLAECLKSILTSNYYGYEIIIIDQSNNYESKRAIDKLIFYKIRYYKMEEMGLSNARNFGLQKAKGSIIAFTDDDCVIDKKWIENIYKTFQKYKNISAVFGQVIPYEKKSHKNEICPCTIMIPKQHLIQKPCFHTDNFGFGNNMAFKKNVFENNGVFKKWLGPGSMGLNGEDAEFPLRLLINENKILYNPSAIIYHNRWLNQKEYNKQFLSYSCGEIACYGYFATQGYPFAKKVIIKNFRNSYFEIKSSMVNLIKLKKSNIKDILYYILLLAFKIRGLLIAVYFSKADPLKFKE